MKLLMSEECPPLKIGVIMLVSQFLGYSPLERIMLNNMCIGFIRMSLPTFKISLRIRSVPADFPFFRDLIHAYISVSLIS